MSTNPATEPTTEEILKEVAVNNPDNIKSSKETLMRAWEAWLNGDNSLIDDLPLEDFPKIRALTEMERGKKLRQDYVLKETSMTFAECSEIFMYFLQQLTAFFGEEHPDKVKDMIRRFEDYLHVEHPRFHSKIASGNGKAK